MKSLPIANSQYDKRTSITTIKQLTIISFSILLGLRFISPERTYVPFTPKKCAAIPRITNFNIISSADMGNNQFILFGTRTLPLKGIGLILYDNQLKQTLYEDFRDGDEDFINPHFFRTSLKSDPIVLLCSTGAEFTYGVSVYLFDQHAVKNIGHMNISLNENPYKSDTDPGPYAKISVGDSCMIIGFSKSVSTDFHGLKQRNYDPGKLIFQYQHGQLTALTK